MARPLSRAGALAGAAVVGGLAGLLYLIQLVHLVVGFQLELFFGIRPRILESLPDILTAPLVHANWAHLWANTLPLLVFGYLAYLSGRRAFAVSVMLSWLCSGLLVWLVGSGLTVGISGVIFGLFTFLLVRGFLNHSWRQILLAVVLFLGYGGILLGVLPIMGRPISWQSHLGGAVGGVLAGVVTRERRSLQRR